MRRRWFGLILVFGLFFLSSCGSEKKTDKRIAEFITVVDFNKLYPEWKKLAGSITDSGTLGNVALNMPDTIISELNSLTRLETFFKNFIKINERDSLVMWAEKMESHGLSPQFYHKDYLAFCGRRIRAGAWSKTDKLPYDSLAKYAFLSADALTGMHHDLSCGRVNPSYTGAIYSHKRRWVNYSREMLRSDMPFQLLSKSEPSWTEYKNLQKELAKVRKLKDESGDDKVSIQKEIKPGEQASSKLLMLVGRRLKLLGYFNKPDSVISALKYYSSDLSEAVKTLQDDYHIKANGYLNKSTALILSFSKNQMLSSIESDMERMRWLGNSMKKNRVWVNIAENRLYAIRNDSFLVEMKTCSGEPRGRNYYERLKRSSEKDSKVMPPDNLETPLFSAPITHIVANPTWHVPRNILVKEMLPELKRNPQMLNKLGYVLKDSKGHEIDPKSIDWGKITPGKVNFSIEQTTGDANSLGLVVIYILNPYSIFLHDTPAKWAFSLDERHVSHGCVRLEEPFKLVEFLTSFNKKDNYDKLRIAAGLPPEHDKKLLKEWKKDQKEMKDSGVRFKREQDKRFNLDSNITVYLVYFTSGLSHSGQMLYFKDSYKYNEKMRLEMRKPGRNRLNLPLKKK